MKSLMLKLLISTVLLNSILFAVSTQDRVLRYEKHRISNNPTITLKKIKLQFTKKLKDNWVGYVFNIDLQIHGKDINVNDVLFSDGKYIVEDLRKINGYSFKKNMHPTLDSKFYNDKYLIAGNKNAQHKIVMFSDPLCPICTGEVPQIIKDVQSHPNTLALYYITMPLDMHPTARVISKATQIAKEQGIKNIEYKVYTAKLNRFFDPYKNRDKQKSLDAFNKVLGTKITMEQIKSKKLTQFIRENLKLSQEALVNGTPTLFFDGEIDTQRDKYKKYIK